MTINVTRSSMPEYEEYCNLIKGIWENRYLTNNGPLHKDLEIKLKHYLKVDNTTLTTNGHLALELAINSLDLSGEIITTPFTFISTTHAIKRCGLKPVFCDIKEDDFTIDSSKIEKLITKDTSAILPVHVYGNVCDVEKIEDIAKKYNLKVIYDAAHAFGVEYKGKGIGSFGDISMFSFHATKVFNTIEGGAITYSDDKLYEKLDSLKNFGLTYDHDVKYIAGNAKMDEFRAAMGIANLKHIDENIKNREIIYNQYKRNLSNVSGIRILKYKDDLKPNYAYFPIVIDKKILGKNRDEVFDQLASNNINARKYFYPISNVTEPYYNENIEDHTPIALKISKNILCLPMYSDLQLEDVDTICNIIMGRQ